MGTLLSLRIQEKFDELTRSEQKLAAVLLDHSDDILTFSAKELSLASGVSAATAARLFKSLGYSDFNEVRLQARQERNHAGPTTTIAVPVEPLPPQSVTPAAHLQLERANLGRTFEALDAVRLEQAAVQLAGARRVWLAGLGPEGAVARLAWSLFSQIRPAVQVLPENGESWPPELASMGPGDLLLLIASRPWPRTFNALLDFSRTARVRMIVIADPTCLARIERHGGIALLCHTVQASQAHSYTSTISMIGLLHMATQRQLGDNALVRADLIEGLREKFLEGD